MMQYRAPRWLAGHGALGGNVQTIWPALYSHTHADHGRVPVSYRRVRWDTPDGDFIDVDFQDAATSPVAVADSDRPLLVLFHGLEGS